MDILILDDWMRDPIPLAAAQDLLELFDDRYGHASTIISSQVPISDWYARFPDPTLADASLTGSCTTLTNLIYWEIPKEKYVDSVPCRTLNV
jgi:DNA replication protein DnaC